MPLATSISHLPTLHHTDIHDRPIPLARIRPHLLDLPHDLLALGAQDSPKDDVLAVEKGRGRTGDEELAAVGVGARVGHREQVGRVVLEGEVLVGEGGVVVDRGRARAVRVQEVAALDHEVLDHAVEFAALVALRAAERRLVHARAVLAEVLGRQGHRLRVEEEFDAAEGFACGGVGGLDVSFLFLRAWVVRGKMWM